MEFLDFLESSSLSIWLRESPSVLAYPTLLAFHTLGMAFLVGISTAIALRLLGFASSIPLAPLRKFFPLIWLSFSISLASGALLLMLDARLFLTMPAFYIKLAGIAAALTIMRMIQARVLSDRAGEDIDPVPKQAQVLAGGALVCWAVAITAGRVTAYISFIGWQSAAAVLMFAVVLLAGRYIAVRLLARSRQRSGDPRGNVNPSVRM
jgi:hypothetical protein